MIGKWCFIKKLGNIELSHLVTLQ